VMVKSVILFVFVSSFVLSEVNVIPNIKPLVEDPYGGSMMGGMGKMMGMGGKMMGGMGKMGTGGNGMIPSNAADTQAMQQIQQQQNTPLNVGKYTGVNGFSQTKSGALVFNGKMDTDCDGAPSCPQIDPSGQTSTSYSYQGKPIDALKANYVVLPRDLNGKVGNKYQLGDIVAVSYNGKTAYGIYADNGPAGKGGEGSVHLTQQLGFNPYCGTKICKGISSGVNYVVFPGSKNLYTNPYDNASISNAGSRLVHNQVGH